MVRSEIDELLKMGTFPPSPGADVALVKQRHDLLNRVAPPISDNEARALVRLFGPDDYYGLAWTVLHLVESSPRWPLEDCLAAGSGEWIDRLRQRVAKKGLIT